MSETGGALIVIGGHEDKEGPLEILRAVCTELRGGKLVIATIASNEPEGYFETYKAAFAKLGLHNLVELYVNERAESHREENLAPLIDAAGVFFTGGDQLRISSQIGDTPIERMVRDIHRRGGLVAGTSAGAAAMSEIMLVNGSSAETHRIGGLHMAPGLGLVRDAIIDQHFAERGRFGRLMGAVAQNPRVVGIGIDENTAIVVRGTSFTVIGEGAVYIVDGEGVSHSNISEAEPHRTLSMHDVRLHILSRGDGFDISTRRPSSAPDSSGSENGR